MRPEGATSGRAEFSTEEGGRRLAAFTGRRKPEEGRATARTAEAAGRGARGGVAVAAVWGSGHWGGGDGGGASGDGWGGQHPAVLCGALRGDHGRLDERPEGDVPDLDGGRRHRQQDGHARLVQPGSLGERERQVARRLPLRHLAGAEW